MTGEGRLLFLGTGGSMGIPVIGCSCGVCRSSSPYNQRLRPSALLTIGDTHLLIDAGPDLRSQALRYGIKRLDGVLLTHAHNDHVAGIDDLRCFYMQKKRPLPLLLSKETLVDISKRFPYIFLHNASAGLVTRFAIQTLGSDRGKTAFLGQDIAYMSYEQMGMKVTGVRIGNLAYISDIRTFPETIYEDLAGVEQLILTALRFEPTPMHFSIDEAIAFVNRVGAKSAWLTHIAHELEHEQTNTYLPAHIRLAYDGLTISFSTNMAYDANKIH